MKINEFRVRPVTRYVLTHYGETEHTGQVRTVGEFPNVESAEEVGVALQALVPGSTLTTIEGRTPDFPPKALVAAMATATAERPPVRVDARVAIDSLRALMLDDPGYAWTWHCNIAMAARDAGAPSPEAQAHAAQFMKNAFGVDTSQMAIGYGLDVAPVAPINGDHLAQMIEDAG